jgi:hypothetical protein
MREFAPTWRASRCSPARWTRGPASPASNLLFPFLCEGRVPSHENPARKPPASAVLAYSGATSGRDGGCRSPRDAGWGRRLRSRSLIPSRAT